MIRYVAAAGFMALGMSSLLSSVQGQELRPVPAFLVQEAETTYALDRQDYLEALRKGPEALAALQTERRASPGRAFDQDEVEKIVEEEVAHAEENFEEVYEKCVAAFEVLKEASESDAFDSMDPETRDAAEVLLEGIQFALQEGESIEKIEAWLESDLSAVPQEVRDSWIALVEVKPAQDEVEEAQEAEIALENPVMIDLLAGVAAADVLAAQGGAASPGGGAGGGIQTFTAESASHGDGETITFQGAFNSNSEVAIGTYVENGVEGAFAFNPETNTVTLSNGETIENVTATADLANGTLTMSDDEGTIVFNLDTPAADVASADVPDFDVPDFDVPEVD